MILCIQKANPSARKELSCVFVFVCGKCACGESNLKFVVSMRKNPNDTFLTQSCFN
jgi:hypothetical protein